MPPHPLTPDLARLLAILGLGLVIRLALWPAFAGSHIEDEQDASMPGPPQAAKQYSTALGFDVSPAAALSGLMAVVYAIAGGGLQAVPLAGPPQPDNLCPRLPRALTYSARTGVWAA